VIDRLSGIYGRLLAGLALVGCAILMGMMVIIVGDVALRNIAIPGLPRGLAWSNEISELMLYLITMCVAPWLLRRASTSASTSCCRRCRRGWPGISSGWAT
jgi:TRAP-type C4-dicarboxylate transport system permease small subunit